MKLIIYVNEDFEEQKSLVDVDEEEVLLNGDAYHDKINERMEGYVTALNVHKIYDKEIEDIPEVEIGPDHKYYKMSNFISD